MGRYCCRMRLLYGPGEHLGCSPEEKASRPALSLITRDHTQLVEVKSDGSMPPAIGPQIDHEGLRCLVPSRLKVALRSERQSEVAADRCHRWVLRAPAFDQDCQRLLEAGFGGTRLSAVQVDQAQGVAAQSRGWMRLAVQCQREVERPLGVLPGSIDLSHFAEHVGELVEADRQHGGLSVQPLQQIDRPLQNRLGFEQVPAFPEDIAMVAKQGSKGSWIARSGFVDPERLFEQRSRLFQLTQIGQHQGKSVQHRNDPWIGWSPGLLRDLESLLQQRSGVPELGLLLEVQSQLAQQIDPRLGSDAKDAGLMDERADTGQKSEWERVESARE